jgi:hypothetical protein
MGKRKKTLQHLSNKTGKRFDIKDIKPIVNYDSRKPIFSLKHMAYKGSYCISKCQGNTKSLILDTILRLSQSTWAQIKSFPKDTGFEKIPSDRFKVPFPPIITPEVPILVVRYDGHGGRLAGFRDKDVYHIILVGKDLYSH